MGKMFLNYADAHLRIYANVSFNFHKIVFISDNLSKFNLCI